MSDDVVAAGGVGVASKDAAGLAGEHYAKNAAKTITNTDKNIFFIKPPFSFIPLTDIIK
ncbi:MAG TPA: hypothetical protein PKJ42_02745 [Candidatus Goldiibacteriota bacterium]|nr:hypothetical protein [Candidatus Goldiibacteriota bacterium]